MTEEVQPRQRQKVKETKEVTYEVAISRLAKFGGFSFLESCVDGIQNLNSERKARKKIFMTDTTKKGERDDLKKTLSLWIDLLSGSKDISDMLDRSKEKEAFVSELLNKNQRIAADTVRELERSYRTVMLFYKNTESDKLRNISIVNAAPEQVRDLDNSRFIDYINFEQKQNYDRLDLHPGEMGEDSLREQGAALHRLRRLRETG